MKKLFRILLWVLLGINIMAVGVMVVCAYAMLLYPVTYPNWSYLGMVFPVPLLVNVGFMVLWLIVKRKYTLVPILGILICFGSLRTYFPVNLFQGEPEGRRCIKVMSYNVMQFGRVSSEEGWDENEMMQYILNSDADLVCLQESNNITQCDGMGVLQKKYKYVQKCDAMQAPLIVASNMEILDSENVNIVSEGNQSFAITMLMDSGDTLTVINNHLESYKLDSLDKEKYKDIFRDMTHGENRTEIESNVDHLESKLAIANKIRAVQADTVAAYIDRCGSKYIIACGDFNDCPLSYVHHTLTRRLNDAYTRSGNGPGLSYHRSGMHFRIDNILVSDNFTPREAKVDKSILASDHYPISCKLYY